MKDGLKGYTIEELLSVVAEESQDKQRITDAGEVWKYLADIAAKDREHFVTITLDGNSGIIQRRVIHIGTLNQSIVHPRDVFRDAIADNAAAIIIAHNHPSGALEPSRADIQITSRLREAGKLVGIEIVDHVILTTGGYYSFSDEGML